MKITTTQIDLAQSRKAMADLIRKGKRFIVTSHRNPDGDAIGSSIALGRLLVRLGKEVRILVRDPWPPQLRHMPGIDLVEIVDELPRDYPDGWDGLFTMECPESDRCGFPILPGPVVNVDHHQGNDLYGEINLLDIDAPSAGEMLLSLHRDLGMDLDAETATAIYVSLASDTGFFRYTNTTLRAFESAAELVRAGANPGEISLWINESVSVAAMKVQALCMSTLEVVEGGKVATMELPTRFLEEAGATAEDSDGLSSLARTIEGVVVSAFFREVERGTRVSLRAKPGADVYAVASSFGGGGHKAASGCFVEAGIAEAKSRVLEVIRDKAFSEVPSSHPVN